jgi:hypothetical protein
MNKILLILCLISLKVFADTYVKIDATSSPHLVVDTVVASSGDTFDPNYTWTDIQGYTPMPEIGWTTTDDVNFTHPGLPYDSYGHTVTMSTVGPYDVYVDSLGYKGKVTHGSASDAAYLSIAIQDNLALTSASAEAFVQSRYSDSTRLNLIGLVLNAQLTGSFPNRLNYLSPLLTWQSSVISYLNTYVTGVQALTGASAVAATGPNFTPYIATDPLITPLGAIAIPN